ncbi:MAG: hypothetical protein QF464_02840, partial [Myxococcota bacterium]|nr:hypothetical protein [Myxococcota bacterium]
MKRLLLSVFAMWWWVGCAPASEVAPRGEQTDVAPTAPLCTCEPEEHCGSDGGCEPDVCVQGESTCATTGEVKHCDDTGASFTLQTCHEQSKCELGACVPIVCEPGVTECQLGYKVTCNSLGTQWVPIPCPETDVCLGGECVFVQPNILLLVDTSYSMNYRIGLFETP